MRTKLRRSLSLLLALGMVMGLLCGNAWAVETGKKKSQLQRSEQVEESSPETMDSTTSGTCGENLTWKLEGTTLTISGTGDMYDYIKGDGPSWCMFTFETVVIGEGVANIGGSAFSTCGGITNFSVADNNPNLCSVDGVVYNKEKTELIFYPCGRNKTTYTIPDGVNRVGYEAFGLNNDSIEQINIPNSLKEIDMYAFSGCHNLKSIAIPANVTSIDEFAFSGCSNLNKIVVDENNKNYCSIDGVVLSKDKTEVVIYPEGRKEASYTILDGVTNISENAFGWNEYLTAVTIPSSVTSIDEFAFSRCISLRKIIVDDNNKNYSSIDGVVLSKDKTKVLIYPAGKKDAHYVIPNTVTTIEGGGVFNCENLTSITIPRGVTNIEEGAFSGFDYLSKIIVDDNNQDYCSVDDVVFNKNKTVLVSYPGGKADSIYTIPTGVTRVGDGAVACNNFLKRVIISDGVTDIGEFAFNGCSHLTRMTIPASVENIGYGAFSACERLADVYYSGSQEEWDKINFDGSNDLENMTIHYNTSGPTEKDISDYNIFLDVGAYTYDGTPKKPAVTVK